MAVKIVQGDSVAAVPAVQHRGGDLRARILLEGEPGRPDNFQFSLAVTNEDFVSPRHKHNFEQLRCVLDGAFDFGRDGQMTAGMVGYFPEGVAYGPQSSKNGTLACVLQFGGVSGSGYLSAAEVKAGMDALAKDGAFHNGIYRRGEGKAAGEGGREGKANQDAFEAIWEFVNGRKLTYPVSPFAAPVLMNGEGAAWTECDAGLYEKRLGSFDATEVSVRLLRLSPGHTGRLQGRVLGLALSGGGRIAEEPLRALTAFHLAVGESAALSAEDEVTLLCYGLPVLQREQSVAAA
jgi:hypothetical protein